MSDIVPRSQVSRSGVQGVVSIAGGVAAFVLAAVSSVPWLGFVVGAVIAVAGFALSRGKKDRVAGVIIGVVGVATLAVSLPLFGGLAHTLLIGAGVVLVGIGGWSLLKFFRGMKSRS
jgi:hypothetical protein